MDESISAKLITNVLQGSAAEEAGIEPGDKVVTINGVGITDVFDYRYLISDEIIDIEIEKASGDIWEVQIEKDEYEDLGLVFESSLMDKPNICKNKCIFCFMDQLAPGMRKTLHFKDDDYRLSFIEGNYVTLTNIGDAELERIIFYKLSPINVSVHATNPELRVKMMSNPHAGNIINQIKKLVSEGITVNCQVVLCKGVNDGKELERTIQDLASLHPNLKSISVVPVGLTRYRENCVKLEGFDRNSSFEVIEQVKLLQEQYLEIYNSRIVFLADEFYLKAGVKIPAQNHYEDFPQIENGVGMVALFKHEFNNYLKRLKYKINRNRRVSVVTGMAAKEVLQGLTAKLLNMEPNLDIHIYAIENHFFGTKITVAGLITGSDIIEQLKGKILGEEILIPEVMLKHDQDIFLDDVSLYEVERELNVKVKKVHNNGKAFVDALLGIHHLE
ncbi:MAG: DUF512 domain-containing protein [Ignavibacteriales bacterium]